MARSSVGARLYYGYRISDYHASTEILAYFSKQLVQRLGPEWHTSPFWQWLLNESKKPSIELVHTNEEKIPSQLVRRNKKQNGTSTPTAPANSLPPKLEIRSKARLPSDEEDLESDDYGSSSRPRHAGKGGLRLQSASKKRTAAEMLDEQPTSGRRARKSAKTSHYVSDPNEDESAAASDSATSDADVAASPRAEAEDGYSDPDGLLVPPPKDAVRVVVHAEKLQPSLSPSGPNGTWVCDEEGCGYVVRAAEEAAGRILVQQHFRDHEDRTQKVALAVTEAERRGRMPIKYAYFPPVLLIVKFPDPPSPPSSQQQQQQLVSGTVEGVAAEPAALVAVGQSPAGQRPLKQPVIPRLRPTPGR
jgi:hypothetical protein